MTPHSDILPFKLLSEDPDMATFVDVDYAELMQRKCKTILGDPGLVSRLGPASGMSARDQAVLFTTSNYIALGCDLSDVSTMQRLLGSVTSSSDAIFFVAEVSMTYMDVAAADAVVKWASTFENGAFPSIQSEWQLLRLMIARAVLSS